MSNRALTWAKGLTVGSASKKLVLLVLADHADDADWSTWAGQETIAQESELGIRTVRRAMADLEGDGLIERTPRRRPDGYRTSDLVRLIPDGEPVDPVDPPTSPATASPARESPDTAAASADPHPGSHRPESHLTMRTSSPANDDSLTGRCGRAESEPSVEPPVEAAAATPGGHELLHDAATLLAQRRARRRPDVGPGWIHNATHGIAADYRARAEQLLADRPDLTAQQLANLLEPPPAPGPPATGQDQTAVHVPPDARTRIAEQRRHPIDPDAQARVTDIRRARLKSQEPA